MYVGFALYVVGCVFAFARCLWCGVERSVLFVAYL